MSKPKFKIGDKVTVRIKLKDYVEKNGWADDLYDLVDYEGHIGLVTKDMSDVYKNVSGPFYKFKPDPDNENVHMWDFPEDCLALVNSKPLKLEKK